MLSYIILFILYYMPGKRMKKKKVDKLMHLRSYTAILLIYVVDYDSIYLTWKIRSDSYWL
jgi:hypothetical protein